MDDHLTVTQGDIQYRRYDAAFGMLFASADYLSGYGGANRGEALWT